jgi:A/G-specific adenine glycosylase
VTALAAAPADDVLAAWAGLGYYSRARNLHRGAAEVATKWAGRLPGTAATLREVPGIGAYTAGAIASIAFGERAPLVDGNVLRVLARIFAITLDVKSTAGGRAIWALAGELMRDLAADAAPGELNQGLMELGALICTPRAPRCDDCPIFGQCSARATGRVAELPVVPARKGKAALALIDRVALWIEADGRILLARRRPEGLFGGLWELPQGDDAAAAAATAALTLGAVGAPHFVHEQVLTHRRLRLRVAAAAVTRAPRPASLGKVADPSYDAVSWHALARVGDLGISTATAAIVRQRHLDKDPRWTSTPKRSPTSAPATTTSSSGSRSSATTPPTPTSPTPRRARPRASTSSSTTRRR